MITVETPRGVRQQLPRDVLRALLRVTVWCKDNGYRCVVLRDPDAAPPRKVKK